MKDLKNQYPLPKTILNEEQEVILDLYLKSLDQFLDSARESETAQVEIETLHLKRILTK